MESIDEDLLADIEEVGDKVLNTNDDSDGPPPMVRVDPEERHRNIQKWTTDQEIRRRETRIRLENDNNETMHLDHEINRRENHDIDLWNQAFRISKQKPTAESTAELKELVVELREDAMESELRANSLSLIADHYYTALKDNLQGLDCTSKAENIYQQLNIRSYKRIRNLMLAARINHNINQYSEVERLINHAEMIRDPESDRSHDEIYEIASIKTTLYDHRNQFANLLLAQRTMEIKVMDLDDVGRQIYGLLSEANVLYSMGSILEGYHLICDACKLLQCHAELLPDYCYRLVRLYSKYEKVLSDKATWTPHIRNPPSVCGSCKKTFEGAMFDPCDRCHAVKYCGLACQTEHLPSHRRECERLGVFRRVMEQSKSVNPLSSILFSIYLFHADIRKRDNPFGSDEVKNEVLARGAVLDRIVFFDSGFKSFVYYEWAFISFHFGDYKKTLECAEIVDRIYSETDPLGLARAWNLVLLASTYLKLIHLYHDDKIRSALTLAKSIIHANHDKVVRKCKGHEPLPNLIYKLATIEEEFCIETGRYQDAVDVFNAVIHIDDTNLYYGVTRTPDYRVFPCRLLMADLFYGMKHFIDANYQCHVMIESCKQDEVTNKKYRKQVDLLKVTTAKAMVDPTSYNYRKKNMPQVCPNCWKVSSEGESYVQCNGCHRIFYCSVQCRKAHWSRHMVSCLRCQGKDPKPGGLFDALCRK